MRKRGEYVLKMALCDDNEEQRTTMTQYLQAYAEQRPDLAVKLSVFSSALDVLESEAKSGNFDIYLLDVVMPEMSGIELGMKLREMGRIGAIVYLTVSPEYAVDSYDAQAFHYLLKPVNPERLYQVLDNAAALIDKRRSACITVKTREGIRLVRLDQIRYAELNGRSVCYHLSGMEQLDSVTIRTSFQAEMAPLLADPGFFACGASFVVNFYYVTAVEKRSLVLEGGERVPLTCGLAAQARQRWMDYWLDSPQDGCVQTLPPVCP